VTEYYTKLKSIWEELDNYRPLTLCTSVARTYHSQDLIIRFSWNLYQQQIESSLWSSNTSDNRDLLKPLQKNKTTLWLQTWIPTWAPSLPRKTTIPQSYFWCWCGEHRCHKWRNRQERGRHTWIGFEHHNSSISAFGCSPLTNQSCQPFLCWAFFFWWPKSW